MLFIVRAYVKATAFYQLDVFPSSGDQKPLCLAKRTAAKKP